MDNSFEKIESEISRLNTLLEKRVSFKRMFLLGVVHGLGTALGATIVAGIFIALMIKVIQTANISWFEKAYSLYTENSLDKSIERK